MTAIIKEEFRQNRARKFLNNVQSNYPDNIYVYIGKSTEWVADEPNPDTPVNSVGDEIEARKDILAVKKLLPADFKQAIERYDWDLEQNTIYQPYSHDVDHSDPLLEPFYVMTTDFNVYKCIKANIDDAGSPTESLTKPSGVSVNIQQKVDGYNWKYLFTVDAADVFKFLTSEFIPVQTLEFSDGSVEEDNQINVQANAVDGAIHRIRAGAFGASYTPATTVTITGDGTGATAEPVIEGGAIVDYTIITAGSGYTEAEVVIDDDEPGGDGATATAILTPIGGHGANPEQELDASYVIVASELDGDESGVFPTEYPDETFRKIGLLINPRLKQGVPSNEAFRFSVTRTGTDGNITNFKLGEGVQLNFSGGGNSTETVLAWDAENNILETSATATGYSGIVIGDIEADSGLTADVNYTTETTAPLSSNAYTADDIDIYSGEILYAENLPPVTRSSSTKEEIRLVLKF